MKLVVCGNHREFRTWCEENRVNPHDPYQAKWIRNRIDMLGFHKVDVVFYGTYYTLKEISEIEREARIIEAYGGSK